MKPSKNIWRLLLLPFFAIGFMQNLEAQQPQVLDSLKKQLDSVKIDTIVIRWPQNKINVEARGIERVNVNPNKILKNSKPLDEKFKRFVPFSFWDSENQFSLNINEVAFVNWNAGGDNSISGLANLNFTRNYKFNKVSWSNELRLRYGVNVQEGRSLRKTDDFIRYTSVFGYRKDTITPWYFSVKFNFNTQFSNGYKYPDRDNPISSFMAPGYLFLGGGATFMPEGKKFNLYISPLTQKATFVLDEALSNQGAFGVDPGENTFMELGFLITNTWEKEILKNILMKHRLNLYTDYLKSFGNIDVDWEMSFNLKVNDYVSANIGTHLIFDNDIKFDEVTADDGTVIDPGIAKIQFKQLLGVGFVYKF
ncbi:DUF3078 domain-containing protein [Croceivirga lutea]|uniref:DUF3078 domain-containing protein n=1 Tax=Croceivirga lutea TaxID=1775167 RepID=UPI001E4197CA|nr:DUF3078 domain-containing protein [Croceivirga lutea]